MTGLRNRYCAAVTDGRWLDADRVAALAESEQLEIVDEWLAGLHADDEPRAPWIARATEKRQRWELGPAFPYYARELLGRPA